MPKPISKTSNSQLKILGWYQVIGGAIGLKKAFDELWANYNNNGSISFLCMVALMLYCFSMYAGRLLLSRNYEHGLVLTFFNQVLQVFSITALGCSFMYISGLMFQLNAHYWHEPMAFDYGAGFEWQYLSQWRFQWFTGSSMLAIGVNLIGLYLSYFTYRLYKKVRKEREYVEINYAVTSKV